MSDGSSSQSPLLIVAVAVAVCAMLFGIVAVAITMNPGTLGSLTDVNTVGSSTNQTLVYNGTTWVNSNSTGGANGSNGATWYNGTGVPSSGLGLSGDMYFRLDNGWIYNKISSSWTYVANITGLQGIQGIPGIGSSGTNGTNGSAGTNGATWYNGTGIPSAGTGVTGDFYFRLDNGWVYNKIVTTWTYIANLTGIQGATGPMGPTGSPGPSGAPGPTGIPGTAGTNGTNGTNGSNGITGITTISTNKTQTNNATEFQLISYTIPANNVSVGTTYRITASGVMGDTSSAPSITWRTRIGTTLTTTSGNITTSVVPTMGTSIANKGWKAEFYFTVRSTGAAGAVIGQGSVQGMIGTSSAFASQFSVQGATVFMDTTQQTLLELTFQFGTANAANTLTCTNALIELVKS